MFRFAGRMGLITLLLVGSAIPAWAQGQVAKVTAERTSLRDKPAIDGAVVVSLVKGDELEVVERTGTWIRVRVKSTGREGYVSSLVVEVSAAPAGGTAAPPRPATPPPAPPPTPAQPPAAAPRQTPAAPQPSQTSASDRPFRIRVYGGLFPEYGATGFGFGGGGAKNILNKEEMEIQVDALYSIYPGYLGGFYSDGTLSVLTVSGNFIYNFINLPNLSFKPFAGGGLAFSRGRFNYDFDDFGSIGGFNSGVNLQLMGGIEKPLSDRRAFRAEIRIGAYGGVALLAGLSF
jgi:hypothetical protein